MPSGRVAVPVVGPRNGAGVDVLLDGRCLHLSEVGNGEAVSDSSGSGQRSIRSLMPGRVVKVLVSPGDEIVVGQGVVILEAMKMENEVKATGAGKVARVLVAEGDRVDAGANMVEFE
ncbi:MAG: acetyl-CoA carboxylase biotin carboxyl carrier protein subunit [Deltaproteobacteria bacterium]|nr:acetyl-CoA carboxylase biotin carboxyl carrier protein subunit [Deltaproteobacteria bacterium]